MSDEKALKIVKLEAANVKRLVAVEIKPDGSLVVVGGKNGAGKTSVLDSIAYALGGREALCDEPLRKGAKKGHVSVDLGEFTVTRTFMPDGGGTLTVVSTDGGAVFRSPQAMLDKLMGRLSFDPLAFARMAPREQRETLRSLVGLDFSALDAARAQHFAARTDRNREAKSLEARLAGIPLDRSAPSEPVSVAALMADMAQAEASDRAARTAEARAEDAKRAEAEQSAVVADCIADVARLQRELEAAGEAVTAERSAEHARRAQAATLLGVAQNMRAAVIDTAPIREAIAAAEGVNARVRANADRARIAAELAEMTQRADALTGMIEALDEDKAKQLAKAEFPVEGLEFDEDGVRFAGIPFSQASSAEQLRVSVAMGLAMNPRLRVLLIRDGSLLDDNSLDLVAQMARAADAQVWMERVGEGAECSVVIEDGAVRGATPE